MITAIAWAAAGLHLAIAGFQVCLVAGKPWGEYAWGGQHKGILPAGFRIGSIVSALLLLFFAWVNLAAASLVPAAGFPVAAAQKFVTGYAALGVLMNGISRSRKERLLWTPVCAIMLVLNSVLLWQR
ncbi:MAG: hypothetical protein ACOY5B_10395 [Spirochaetota bacterium]